jgi:hypothetical protein
LDIGVVYVSGRERERERAKGGEKKRSGERDRRDGERKEGARGGVAVFADRHACQKASVFCARGWALGGLDVGRHYRYIYILVLYPKEAVAIYMQHDWPQSHGTCGAGNIWILAIFRGFGERKRERESEWRRNRRSGERDRRDEMERGRRAREARERGGGCFHRQVCVSKCQCVVPAAIGLG